MDGFVFTRLPDEDFNGVKQRVERGYLLLRAKLHADREWHSLCIANIVQENDDSTKDQRRNSLARSYLNNWTIQGLLQAQTDHDLMDLFRRPVQFVHRSHPATEQEPGTRQEQNHDQKCNVTETSPAKTRTKRKLFGKKE